MSVERLELSTNGLKGRCSAIELHARSGVHSIMPMGLRQSAARSVLSHPSFHRLQWRLEGFHFRQERLRVRVA